MRLKVYIEHKVKDNVAIPINTEDDGLLQVNTETKVSLPNPSDDGLLQVRHDGVYINGELHLAYGWLLLLLRHDGVYINGELHLWENIKRVIIENEEEI